MAWVVGSVWIQLYALAECTVGGWSAWAYLFSVPVVLYHTNTV